MNEWSGVTCWRGNQRRGRILIKGEGKGKGKGKGKRRTYVGGVMHAFGKEMVLSSNRIESKHCSVVSNSSDSR